MKKILLSFIFFTQLFWSTPVLAASWDFNTMLDDFQESVTEESQNVEPSGEGVTLPTFANEADEGAYVVVLALKRLLDFLKLVMTPIAVLYLVIIGVKMVSAGKDNEEVTTEAKNHVSYMLYGLIIIFVADSVVSVFFGPEGEIFRGGAAGAEDYAARTSNLFTGMMGLVETLIGAIAVFTIITAGMRYVAGSYDDDQIAKAKKQIQWALVGLFVIGVSEFIVKRILFQDQGSRFGMDEARQLFVQMTNFISGAMGTVAFVMLLYSGYLYVTAAQNEDNVAKAKKIIMWSLGGIVIALAAFAFTNTLVALDATR